MCSCISNICIKQHRLVCSFQNCSSAEEVLAHLDYNGTHIHTFNAEMQIHKHEFCGEAGCHHAIFKPTGPTEEPTNIDHTFYLSFQRVVHCYFFLLIIKIFCKNLFESSDYNFGIQKISNCPKYNIITIYYSVRMSARASKTNKSIIV